MRGRIPLITLGPDSAALAGVQVAITDRDGGGAATIYAGDTGAAQLGVGSVLSIAGGVVPGWLERGGYRAIMTHASGVLHPDPIDFEVSPSRDNAQDLDWLPLTLLDAVGLPSTGRNRVATAAQVPGAIVASPSEGPADVLTVTVDVPAAGGHVLVWAEGEIRSQAVWFNGGYLRVLLDGVLAFGGSPSGPAGAWVARRTGVGPDGGGLVGTGGAAYMPLWIPAAAGARVVKLQVHGDNDPNNAPGTLITEARNSILRAKAIGAWS